MNKPKTNVKAVVIMIIFTYSIYVGGVMVGFNANNRESWWFSGSVIFTAIAILVFSIYTVKIAEQETSERRAGDEKLQLEIDSLNKRIRELEKKNDQPAKY